MAVRNQSFSPCLLSCTQTAHRTFIVARLAPLKLTPVLA